MALNDWDPLLPSDRQDSAWSCSAASLAWGLKASGHPTSEATVIVGLGPTRISPAQGLLDASGAGLVEYLGELGIQAWNNPAATYDDLCAAAGEQPMVIGGRTWNHWSGVRMKLQAGVVLPDPVLLLANPAPGWMEVYDIFTVDDWFELGGFSAVWWAI